MGPAEAVQLWQRYTIQPSGLPPAAEEPPLQAGAQRSSLLPGEGDGTHGAAAGSGAVWVPCCWLPALLGRKRSHCCVAFSPASGRCIIATVSSSLCSKKAGSVCGNSLRLPGSPYAGSTGPERPRGDVWPPGLTPWRCVLFPAHSMKLNDGLRVPKRSSDCRVLWSWEITIANPDS